MKTKLVLCLFLLFISFSSPQNGFLSKKMHVWGVIVNGTSHFHVDGSGNFYVTGAFEDSVFLDANQEWIVPMDSTDFFMVKFNPEGQVIWKKLITGMGQEHYF